MTLARTNVSSGVGGGASGADREHKQQIILLDVNGEKVLMVDNWYPPPFDERYPLVQEVFNSITFGK